VSNKGLGTNIVCQIGIVVENIDRAIEAYSEIFNQPMPEVSVTAPLEKAHTRYRGEPTEARAKLAFFDMGQVNVELIEPIGGPSTWRDFLEENGEGVHHIAFFVDDTEEAVAFLETKGVDVVQQGDYTGGRYTYLDSTPQLAVMLELLENFDQEEEA